MIADTLATSLSPQAIVPTTRRPVADALSTILDELRTVLSGLDSERYAAKMGALFGNSSIGAHVRHVLNHARALVDGAASGTIDYDHRVRGTAIETDPAAALRELEYLINSTRLLAGHDAGEQVGEQVGVAIMPTRDGESVTLTSSLARELAFVLSHSIHHNATICGMAVAAGHDVPEGFGYAPSTLAHAATHSHPQKDRCACVR